MLTLEDHNADPVPLAGLLDAPADVRYPYDTCVLVHPALHLLLDGERADVEDDPLVATWRQRMLLQTKGKGYYVDNKEAYRVKWKGETWYVLFYDGRITLSEKARVL